MPALPRYLCASSAKTPEAGRAGRTVQMVTAAYLMH